MATAARSNDYTLVARNELDFHSAITRSSGNELLISIFRGIEGQVLMGLALDDSGYPDLAEVAREHEPLIVAIESGDEGSAERLMHAHILSTVGDLIARLGGSPDDLVANES
jgi:DNA-binding GntR family transcriptional regulator